MKLKKRLKGVNDAKINGYAVRGGTMVHRKELIKPDPNAEKLVAVGIERAGIIHSGAAHRLRSHWELRLNMGDERPEKEQPGDVNGFMTSAGRFLTRSQAVPVAIAAGQLRPGDMGRELLSSDIRW